MIEGLNGVAGLVVGRDDDDDKRRCRRAGSDARQGQ